MKNVAKLFTELRVQKFTVSERAGAKVIKSTELSVIKKALVNALVADFKEALNESELVDVYDNMVLVAIENEFVDEITFELNPKVKSLDFNAYEAIENYKDELLIKEQAAAEKAANKAAKIKRDEAARALKNAQKEKAE